MSRSFTVASDENLNRLILTATERLVVVAPGLSLEVALTLANRIKRDGGPKVVSVILDVDPEVCRLGFGDIESLDLIGSALALKGLQIHTQKGVRIGLVIADGEVLV